MLLLVSAGAGCPRVLTSQSVLPPGAWMARAGDPKDSPPFNTEDGQGTCGGQKGRGHLLLQGPHTDSLSSFPQPNDDIPIKLNTAAILREGALYQRQVEKELQRWGEGCRGWLLQERRQVGRAQEGCLAAVVLRGSGLEQAVSGSRLHPRKIISAQ